MFEARACESVNSYLGGQMKNNFRIIVFEDDSSANEIGIMGNTRGREEKNEKLK